MRLRLPEPRFKGPVSVEEAILERRSVRRFRREPLTLEEVSQLLWSAQGITGRGGYRAAPSAGALYPLELYVVAGLVDGLESGVYHYSPEEHSLDMTFKGDVRSALSAAALHQEFVEEAPVSFVIAAVYDRVTRYYGERGVMYVHFEVGHAAQNLSLMAVALGLGSVPVGAFRDNAVSKVLGLSPYHHPLYILPVGKPA